MFCFFHVVRSVSLSAPLTYFTPHPNPNPLPSGNHRCVSVLFRFGFLYCRLGSTCKTQTERVFLPDLFHIAKYSAGSPCCGKRQGLIIFLPSMLPAQHAAPSSSIHLSLDARLLACLGCSKQRAVITGRMDLSTPVFSSSSDKYSELLGRAQLSTHTYFCSTFFEELPHRFL